MAASIFDFVATVIHGLIPVISTSLGLQVPLMDTKQYYALPDIANTQGEALPGCLDAWMLIQNT